MTPTRRALLVLIAAAVSLRGTAAVLAATLDTQRRKFVEAAFAMKQQAERLGDQPYGAVVVRGGTIVGWGPSRVLLDNDGNAHAERVALKDAQTRLGKADLSDCVMYSTSHPCGACERAAAVARLSRMYYGRDAIDAGAPRGG
jgi:tRNA(adenine34) deaminase